MTDQFRPPQSKAEADPRRWPALLILLLANFMNLMDVTIVNVALPSLQTNMGATSSQMEWVIAAYVLAFALGLLPFGRLGDIVGRTRMFLVGVALFTVASAFCGMAPSIEWLIFARVLQGFAGAIMTPQVMAIAQVTFPPEERGTAFSLFGLSAGLAAVAGPIVGGLLIGADIAGLDWRPIFLVNVPIGIVAVVAGWFMIPRTPGHPGITNDWVGIALFSAGIVLVVFPLVEGRAYDWPLWAFGMMGASVVALVLFALWERHRQRQDASQLLNFSLISNGNFMLGLFITMAFASGVPGFFMAISILLQGGFDFTPLHSGLTNTPFSVGVIVSSIIAGRLGTRYLRGRVATGAALLALGMLWLRMIFTGFGDEVDTWAMLPPLFLSGVGLGMGFSGLFQTVIAGVPPRDAGSGSGSLQAMQQVGSALGVALVGELFFTTLQHDMPLAMMGQMTKHAAFVDAAVQATTYEIAVFALVVVLIPFLKGRPHNPQGAPSGMPMMAEV